jgi:hypothetical protein
VEREDRESDSYFWSEHEADDELTRLKLIEQNNGSVHISPTRRNWCR